MNAAATKPSPQFAQRWSALQGLAQSSLAPEQFYADWLAHVVDLTGALGGRMRRPASDGTLAPTATLRFDLEEAPTNEASADSPSRYERLVLETFTGGRPKVVPPRGNLGDEADANPTSGALLLVPLVRRRRRLPRA